MMNEKIDCTVVRELIQGTRQSSNRVSRRRWSWEPVGRWWGMRIGMRKGGSAKEGSSFVSQIL